MRWLIDGCFDCPLSYSTKTFTLDKGKFRSNGTQMVCALGGSINDDFKGLYPYNCPLRKEDFHLTLKIEL